MCFCWSPCPLRANYSIKYVFCVTYWYLLQYFHLCTLSCTLKINNFKFQKCQCRDSRASIYIIFHDPENFFDLEYLLKLPRGLDLRLCTNLNEIERGENVKITSLIFLLQKIQSVPCYFPSKSFIFICVSFERKIS